MSNNMSKEIIENAAKGSIKTNEYRKQFDALTEEQQNDLLSVIFDAKIEKLKVTNDDVVLLKGEWTESMVDSFLHVFNKEGRKNVIMVLSHDSEVEAMDMRSFYNLLIDTKSRLDGEL